MIYQEQIMQTIMEMGNCTLGYADIARRAMGKKSKELMAKMRNEFKFGLRVYDINENHEEVYNINNDLILKENGDPVILGACNNGFTEQEADSMWNVIQEFAKYAFNKSHAAAYGLNAYQTAYLKYYYAADFMANALTACDGEQKDIIKNIGECKRLGVMILPPDVNKSLSGFTVEIMPDGRKGIRFGIGAIKGIAKIDSIIEQRAIKPFDSVKDFFSRVSGREVSRSKAESLILAGGFDSIEPNRHAVYNEYFGVIRKENAVSQKEYDVLKDSKDKKASKSYVWQNVNGYNEEHALFYEKELIGLYVSGHPLDKYPYQAWDGIWQSSSVECFAIIKNLTIRQTKQNKTFAFFKAETLGDVRDCVMWANEFSKYGDKLAEGRTVCLRGEKSTNQRGDDQFKVEQVLVQLNRVSGASKKSVAPPPPPPSSISETYDPMGDLFTYN